MRKILEHFANVTIVATTASLKSSIIEDLCSKSNLIAALMNNLKTYHESASQAVRAQKLHPEAISNLVVQESLTHPEQISERLDFLNFIMKNSHAQITAKELNFLWELLCENAIYEGDRQCMYKLLNDACQQSAGEYSFFAVEDGIHFFNTKLCSEQNKFTHLTMDAFNCIQNFFLLINEKEERLSKFVTTTNKYSYTSYSNVGGALYHNYGFTKKQEEKTEFTIESIPSELKGIGLFWRIIIEAQEKDVVVMTIDFINKLYTQLSPKMESQISQIRSSFIQTYFDKFEELQGNEELEEEDKKRMVSRMILLLKDMIDESERKGTGGLKSHSALLKGDLVTLSVTNNLSSKNKKFDLHVYSNTTIWELKRAIGKQVESSAECIRILYMGTEVKDCDNGKTLADLRFKAKANILVSKKSMDNIPKTPLIDSNKQMIPKAVEIFTSWFHKFAIDGMMNAQGCADFVRSCTNDTCKADDRRVIELFKTYDDDKDGFISHKNFMEFYRSACLDRETVVWSNLASNGYRNDLKKLSEVEESFVDIKTLPRYILSQTEKSFDLFFNILDMGGPVAADVWGLISRLTTNPQLYDDILNFDTKYGKEGVVEWEKVINNQSIYRFIYSLQIIEYFLDEPEPPVEETDDSTPLTKELKRKEGDLTPPEPEKDLEMEKERDDPEIAGRDVAMEEQKEIIQKEKLARESAGNTEAPKPLETEKSIWRVKFIEQGGFKYLLSVFHKWESVLGSKSPSSRFEKECLQNLVKVISIFVMGSIGGNNTEIYNVVKMVRTASLKPEKSKSILSVGEGDAETGEEHTPEFMSGQYAGPYMYGPTLPPGYAGRGGSYGGGDKEESAHAHSDKDKDPDQEIKLVESSNRCFQQLAAQLKGNLGIKLLQSLNLQETFLRMLDICSSIITKEEIEFEDNKLVKTCLGMATTSLLYENTLFDDFLQHDFGDGMNYRQFILAGVLFPHSYSIREEFRSSFFYIAKKLKSDLLLEDPLIAILGLLLDNMPVSNDQSSKECGEYFELLCYLLDEYYLLQDPTSTLYIIYN